MSDAHGGGADDPFGLAGKLLERKYRVDRRAAEGGFGVVYAGHHVGLDTPIAIKVLKRSPHLDADAWADVVSQFVMEAKTIAKLRHPAVVSVIDAGITPMEDYPEGLPWMVMEWLDGETLADDLARRREKGGRSRAETFAILRPVVEALAEAHEAGIVHRDLKPSNIMLLSGKRGPSARVLDFGIAKIVAGESSSAPSGHTETEAIVKTFSAASAAPEQLSGTRTGPWTDVHALGLLFAEMLTDQPPYPLVDANEHYRAVFDVQRPTPGSRGIEVGEWEAILVRALSLKPSDRYPNAGELLAALDAVGVKESTERSVSLPVRSESEGERNVTTSRTTTPARRARWPYAAAALAGAGILAIAWPLRKPSPSVSPVPVLEAPKCTSNAACSKERGQQAICRRDVGCIDLKSQDCEVYADDAALASDDTVWIGTMFPTTGDDATTFGLSNTRAVDLARRDFAQIMAGVSSARRFGLVACDDAVDPRRAATHLVDRVGVPAVIGFHASVEAIDLATSLFLPKRVLVVAALNTNPLVTAVPQPPDEPRLVWRTTYNSAGTAAALSALVGDVLEPQLHLPRTMRVALLRPKNAAGAAFSEAFFKTLRFNGKSALDNRYDFRELTFESDKADNNPEYAAILKELSGFTPDVIVYSGGTSLISGVFAPLEESWPRTATHRPRYASIALLPRELLDYVGKNTELRKRFFGVTPVSTTPPNARFVMHYNEAFPDKITRTIAPNSSYDAFYLLAYASYALKSREAVTGPSLSRAMARLVPPGHPIDVGLSGIFDAYGVLRAGKNVDLNGATGKLDFDRATGEAPFDQAILCMGIDETGRAFDGIESGLVYSAGASKLAPSKLEGAMRCP